MSTPPSPSAHYHASFPPRSPACSSSIASSPLSHHSDVHSHRTLEDVSHTVSPRSLHLKPVTEEELRNIQFPPGETFEVVDGLLVWIPMSAGTSTHQRVPALHAEYFNLRSNYNGRVRHTQETSAPTKTKARGIREADLIITRRSSPASSEENPSPQTKRPVSFAHRSLDKPADAISEFTSSNRDTDTCSKWSDYRKAGVAFYYIFDLKGMEWSKEARVSVGSISQVEGSFLSSDGDPDHLVPLPDGHPSATTSYYKKVFRGNEIVDVGPYAEFGFSAAQLMSATFMSSKVEEERARNARKSREITCLSAENTSLSARNTSLSARNTSLSAENSRLSALNNQQADRIAELERAVAASGKSSSRP